MKSFKFGHISYPWTKDYSFVTKKHFEKALRKSTSKHFVWVLLSSNEVLAPG